jgi:hypothetical protein
MYENGEFVKTGDIEQDKLMEQFVDFYLESQNALYLNAYESLCEEFGITKLYDSRGN